MLTLKLCLIFTLTCVCLFFSLYLFIGSPNRKGKYWLAATFVGLTLINGIELLFYFPAIKNSIALYFDFIFYQKETLQIAIIPAFALYLLKYHANTKTVWVHFLPAISSLAYCIIFALNSPATVIDMAVCHRDVWSVPLNYTFIVVQSLQIIYYILILVPVLSQRQNQEDDITKSYHNLLFRIIFACNVMYVINYILDLAYETHILAQTYVYVIYLFTSLLAYIVLFLLETKHALVSQTLGQITQKYAGSSLTTENKEQIMAQIKEYMETKQPYLNQEFTLENMSEDISILRTHISQVINEEYKMNFREYINMYRIKESIRLLEEDNQENGLNINQIFYESGFNSKSVFNTAFKKHTNLTPSEYRKKVGSTLTTQTQLT
jgi:AraC-like DNA-binding protein